jgi:hypothetical protein
MKPAEINKRIAIVCGWQVHSKDKWVVIPPNSPHSVQQISTIPDYYNDLNAMHEAEAALTPIEQSYYSERLGDFSTFERGEYPTFHFLHSNAAKRAEAFLRTINQWEE